MRPLTLLFSFTFLLVLNVQSQNFEGTITYDISYKDLTEEMKKMMPQGDLESTFSIKGSKSKMEMNVMGANTVIIFDVETNTSTSYTDVMGQKIKSTSSTEDEEEVEISLIDGETKTIAGYRCKKAVIKQADMPDVEVYYSEDLKSDIFSRMNPQFKKLNGFPLEYQVHQQGMTMVSTAKDVTKKSLSSSDFDPPEGDYKEAPNMPKY